MTLRIGQHLFTKDGRRQGNAIVTGFDSGLVSIETDFGSIATRLNENEIEESFHKLDFYGEERVSKLEEWRSSRLENINSFKG